MKHRFIIVDAPQRSPEWDTARLGKLTGSRAPDAFARTKGGWAASRKNLMYLLVLERITGKSGESDYVSPAMQAGIDREPFALRAYEALTGNTVSACGFLQHPTLMAGTSPDGYVGNFERIVSIKCRQPAAHVKALRGVIPHDAMTQIRHELWITGAEAVDYFCWNPDFPDTLQGKLITVHRQDADIPGYEKDALCFLAECDMEEQAIRTAANLPQVLEQSLERTA